MSADVDRIALATADLMANITDEMQKFSPRPVGYGGYSDIYTAVWCSAWGEMKVAVKVIRTIPMPSQSKESRMPHALRREISVWKRLIHRNIHTVCGFYEGFGSTPAMVSPWCENGDINDYVRQHAADPDVDTLKLKLFADVMSGLKFLHDNYVIHGDIKGGNILISDGGVARLCDFGLSSFLLDLSQSITHTGVKGTSRWMAPELLINDGARHSYASDIWACGCLFIQVWSSVVPYHTKSNDMQVISAMLRKERPARPSDMPDFLWSIVEACCNPDVVRRPSAIDVIAYFSLQAIMQRVHQMVTLGRPTDSFGAELLGAIVQSLRQVDPTRVSELYILSDAEVAKEILRILSAYSLSLVGGSSPVEGPLFLWCIMKLGIDHLQLPAGDSFPTVEDETFFDPLFGLSEPAKLRPLARLIERARPGLGAEFMTQFATVALSHPLLLNTELRVRSVAWFPNGDRVVAGYEGGSIHVIELSEGRATPPSLVGHEKDVNNVAVSPNGTLLASCSGDTNIKLWDAETGLAVGAPLAGHTDCVWSVAFSPDGRRIVSGSSDTTIRVWNVETCMAVLGPLHGHSESVSSVVYSTDGSRIASGSLDHTVWVWDARTGDAILTLRGHTSSVSSVAYSPHGLHIASGSNDRTVRIWDAVTGQLVGVPLNGHSDGVLSVAYSPDGTRIVSGSDDHTIRIWDDATGASIATVLGHTDLVSSVAFSPTGRRIASASRDSTIRIWDATDDWMRWDI